MPRGALLRCCATPPCKNRAPCCTCAPRYRVGDRTAPRAEPGQAGASRAQPACMALHGLAGAGGSRPHRAAPHRAVTVVTAAMPLPPCRYRRYGAASASRQLPATTTHLCSDCRTDTTLSPRVVAVQRTMATHTARVEPPSLLGRAASHTRPTFRHVNHISPVTPTAPRATTISPSRCHVAVTSPAAACQPRAVVSLVHTHARTAGRVATWVAASNKPLRATHQPVDNKTN